MDIIIPSIKSQAELLPLITEIRKYTDPCHKVITTGYKVSAAVNRNIGLIYAESDIVVMMDDDMTGFYHGWIDDIAYPILNDNDAQISTARLINKDGSKAIMMGWQDKYPDDLDYVLLKEGHVPTACICFRNNGVRFDENFVGSGFEDTDFCDEVMEQCAGDGYFVLANKCRLIHTNEQKNQRGKIWKINEKYYRQKVAKRRARKTK